MRVIGEDIIEAFVKEHPMAKKSVEAWLRVIKNNVFRHFADLKGFIRSADYVKPYTIFNISKNKYRLISQVVYGIQAVQVERIIAHKEYDTGKWRRGL